MNETDVCVQSFAFLITVQAGSSSNTQVEQIKSWRSLDLIEGSNIYTLDLQGRKQMKMCIYFTWVIILDCDVNDFKLNCSDCTNKNKIMRDILKVWDL